MSQLALIAELKHTNLLVHYTTTLITRQHAKNTNLPPLFPLLFPPPSFTFPYPPSPPLSPSLPTSFTPPSPFPPHLFPSYLLHLPLPSLSLFYLLPPSPPLSPTSHSIRAAFGTDTTMNAVHASDSHEMAARELAFFLPKFKAPWVPGTEPPIERTLALIKPDALAQHRGKSLSQVPWELGGACLSVPQNTIWLHPLYCPQFLQH